MSSTDPFYDPQDREDERYYCVHGTFLGNPYGADYMCGWCEDGISYADYKAAMHSRFYARLRERLTTPVVLFVGLLAKSPDEIAPLVRSQLASLKELDADSVDALWQAVFLATPTF